MPCHAGARGEDWPGAANPGLLYPRIAFGRSWGNCGAIVAGRSQGQNSLATAGAIIPQAHCNLPENLTRAGRLCNLCIVNLHPVGAAQM